MLRYAEVFDMFSGLHTAFEEDRKPTDKEVLDAILDAHQILASIVESLTVLAGEAVKANERNTDTFR